MIETGSIRKIIKKKDSTSADKFSGSLFNKLASKSFLIYVTKFYDHSVSDLALNDILIQRYLSSLNLTFWVNSVNFHNMIIVQHSKDFPISVWCHSYLLLTYFSTVFPNYYRREIYYAPVKLFCAPPPGAAPRSDEKCVW